MSRLNRSPDPVRWWFALKPSASASHWSGGGEVGDTPKADLARAFGADDVHTYDDETWGDPVDLVLDAAGGNVVQRGVDVLSRAVGSLSSPQAVARSMPMSFDGVFDGGRRFQQGLPAACAIPPAARNQRGAQPVRHDVPKAW